MKNGQLYASPHELGPDDSVVFLGADLILRDAKENRDFNRKLVMVVFVFFALEPAGETSASHFIAKDMIA
jgi:hypothetical protein